MGKRGAGERLLVEDKSSLGLYQMLGPVGAGRVCLPLIGTKKG
jgi:hypothetical protein